MYDRAAASKMLAPRTPTQAMSEIVAKPGLVKPGESRVNLDSPQLVKLHQSLLGHHVRELDRQAVNRREMALDERFYDNDPWSDMEKAILAERGQMATNFNVVATTLNWLIGTERRGRTDYRVLPRRKEGSRAAERKSQLLKYLSDASNSEFVTSLAFASAVKCGIGWIESGWQDTDDGEPIFDRAENWRNMLWDSLATQLDLSDARFVNRFKWADVDMAISWFPHRQEMIERSATSSNEFGGGFLDDYGDQASDSAESVGMMAGRAYSDTQNAQRDRVRLIECYFRRPAMSDVISGGDFSGELFDPFSEGHLIELDSGRAQLVRKVRMRTYGAIFTTSGLLHFQASPYRHNRFPFTPVWCYRRAEDNMPYGLIRGLRDLQTSINKSASKAQYIMATNKTVMEQGAVDDLDAYAEEVARPDAIIVVKPGKRLDLNVDRQLAPAHLDFMSRVIQMVQTQSGVTDESLGRTTNAVSGKAITARQDQGALATAEPFDNLRFARKIHGEKMLSLIEQFMPEEKSFRITNSRGTPEYVTINDGNPENDITLTKADFILTEQAWSASMRQANAQMLVEFIERVAPGQPQILMSVIDLIAESMDLPNQEELVKRFRQLTGMKDPDEDPNAPKSPEEMAAEAAKQAQQQLQQRGAEAEVAKMEAEAALKQAQADKTAMDTAKVAEADLPAAKLAAFKAAMEAALAILSTPQAARSADMILEQAGVIQNQPPAAPPAPPQPGAVPTYPDQMPTSLQQGM